MAVRKQILSLIAQDVKWHRENPGASACGKSFENGFIVGLQQAARLVRKALPIARKRKAAKRLPTGRVCIAGVCAGGYCNACIRRYGY